MLLLGVAKTSLNWGKGMQCQDEDADFLEAA